MTDNSNTEENKHQKGHQKKDQQSNKKAEESPSFPKWVIGLLAIIIIVAIVFGTKGMWQTSDSSNDDPAWATVNTERIRQSYIDRRYNEIGEAKQLITQEEFLDTIISERLLIQQAKQQGFEVSPQEVQTEYDLRLAATQTSREDLSVELLKQNLTEQDLLDTIYNELLINQLLNEVVVSKVEVTDEELQELFDLNQDTFQVQEAVRASHILVETEKEALALKAVVTPDNFNDYARNSSIDPTAESNSGDLGFFERGMMVKPFEDIAFRLEPNQISDPVITQFGIHLILVHEHKEAGNLEFDEVKEFLYDNMLDQKTTLAAKEYLDKLNEIAQIEILVEFDEQGNLVTKEE